MQFNFNNILFESNEPDAKDIKRISDMVTKSNGNDNTAQKLAAKMVNSITNAAKMERRYLAAQSLLGDDNIITQEFAKGCKSMGITIKSDSDTFKEPDDETLGNTFDEITQISNDEIIQASEQLGDNETFDKNNNSIFDQIKADGRIQKILSEQLSHYDLVKIAEDAITNTKLRTQVSDINNIVFNKDTGILSFNFNLGGFKVRKIKIDTGTYYIRYEEYRDVYVWFAVNNVKFSIIKNQILLDNINASITGWGHTKDKVSEYSNNIRVLSSEFDSFRGKNSVIEKILPTINAIQKSINNELNKVPKIQELVTKYQEYVGSSGTPQESIIKFVTPRLGTSKSRIYENITQLICNKFNVDDLPDIDNKWPGFSISIDYDKEKCLFAPYIKDKRNYLPFSYSSIDDKDWKVLKRWLNKIFGKNNVFQYTEQYEFPTISLKVLQQKLS